MNVIATQRSSCERPYPAAQGDLRNLLQVAASTLHLVERLSGEDLRPLTRLGLTAIREAALAASPDRHEAISANERTIA